MSYPMLESPIGDVYYFDGDYVYRDSPVADMLALPTDNVTYYETVRIKEGVLLYLEAHLERLSRSVKGIEDFEVDLEEIEDASYALLRTHYKDLSEGNLRIVLTRDDLLIHICEANIPSPELFKTGIDTAMLKWDRVDPNIKVFRGDYKEAVRNTFERSGAYEVLLCDKNGLLYEGSKSNLFVVKGDTVYSAPDDKILLGITRKRVLESLNDAGLTLRIGMFSLDELKDDPDAALFVSSTPFDILPVRSVDGIIFDSADNAAVRKISACYTDSIRKYINERR